MNPRGRLRSRWAAGLGAAAAVAVLTLAAWWIARGGRVGAGDPLGRGISAYRDGDWHRAEAAARSILKARPGDVGATRLLARAAARQGRDETAEAIYRRLGTRSMEAEDLFLLGDGLLRRGLAGPAMAALGAARDLQPDHADTLDALARYWAGSRSMTDALEAAERLSRLPGWEVRGSILRGRLRAELFDPAGAAAALAEALGRDPELKGSGTDPRQIEILLVRCLLQGGRPAEASERLRRLEASAGSTDPEAAWLLSRALLQEGRIAEAGAALGRAGGYGSLDPMLREPAPFVGARSCAPCHPDQFDAQQGSRHAQTLVGPGRLASLPWPERTVADRDHPRVTHRFGRDGDRIEVATTVEGRTFRAVVEYAMGSNHQGQSFLARDHRGDVHELRVSRYPLAPEWDRTMEHPAVPPDPSGYLGRPVSAESFRKCLHCHATDFRTARDPEGRPEASDRGIGCERCHGPGGHHERAIRGRFAEPAIARPRLASAGQVLALCGDCHTAPPSTTPSDPGFVRYQASGFVLSRCYNRGGESFSCVTCHDPHQDVETAPASYEAKCLECHASNRPASATPKPAPGRGGPSCPVNPRADCLSCHMPRVRDAVPRTVFTDHRIRVRRP